MSPISNPSAGSGPATDPWWWRPLFCLFLFFLGRLYARFLWCPPRLPFLRHFHAAADSFEGHFDAFEEAVVVRYEAAMARWNNRPVRPIEVIQEERERTRRWFIGESPEVIRYFSHSLIASKLTYVSWRVVPPTQPRDRNGTASKRGRGVMTLTSTPA